MKSCKPAKLRESVYLHKMHWVGPLKSSFILNMYIPVENNYYGDMTRLHSLATTRVESSLSLQHPCIHVSRKTIDVQLLPSHPTNNNDRSDLLCFVPFVPFVPFVTPATDRDLLVFLNRLRKDSSSPHCDRQH